ncbi:AraC family transcriptional regulator [uncultured Desulfobacter sp.]|uniref:helix-turn-helix domain-containing protein n=1 Tax=uncultured Desulfobacter sp. TaxID=240139 RepID=UPI0029F4739E|nr:AraC family transcriptional regulator [uncultured Desulfobacter sp.]
MSYNFNLDNNDDFYYFDKIKQRSVLRFPKKLGFIDSYKEIISDEVSVFKADMLSYEDINMSTYSSAKSLQIIISLNGNSAYFDKIVKEDKEDCKNFIRIDYINEVKRNYFLTKDAQCSGITIVIRNNTFLEKSLFNHLNDKTRDKISDNYNKNFTTTLKSSLANYRTLLLAKEIYNSPFEGELNNIYLRSKVYEIIYNEFNWLININRPSSSSNNQIILRKEDIEALHKTRDFVIENKKNFSINELAKKAYINKNKLRYGFNQLFNTTPGNLVFEVKMHEAKRLLEGNELNITEVSDSIGYKHVQSFSNAFKNYFGITPSEFIKSKRGT